jgi:6-pyruvoyltetrahydropterin/6-carboxytetrahydropterin synthase
MYRLRKSFKFEASHQLEGLPEGHQCGRLHGHSYEFTVFLIGSELMEEGWLVDFGELRVIKSFIDDHLDHRHLNDILGQPTSENLAKWLFGVVNMMLLNELSGYDVDPSAHHPDLVLEKVRVSETDKTYAEYYGVPTDL